jgi:tRNA nucleotidyltransferase/poly(A) polymerase
MSQTGAIEIAADLRSHSFQAWLVGGCVRDLILGHEPSDYDISTDARPEELLRLFPRAQRMKLQPSGATIRTLMAGIPGRG